MKAKTACTAIMSCLVLTVSALAADGEAPAWVKNLRAGKLAGPTFKTETAKTWLKANLHRNGMTKPEVFALLGDPAKQKIKIARFAHDLDRPDRDAVDSYQYVLWFGDSVNWGALTVDFDRNSGKLIDYGIASCICGFCPHVLADDGERWRLEGKMLAGCVGAERAGSDLLVLPRLNVEEGIARIKLANWAPEIEELRDPQLFAVALRSGEQLDTGVDGEPVVWSAAREIAIGDGNLADGDLLVLEAKNTSAMEHYLRGVFLAGKPDSQSTSLNVDFGAAGSVMIDAVGTKFLRRVVVPIPNGANRVSFEGQREFWFLRRAWVGRRESFSGRSAWMAPIDSSSRQFRLDPGETAQLEFAVPLEGKLSFALRLNGFYLFDPPAEATLGRQP